MCRIVSWDSYLSINLVMKYQAFATMQESVSIDWRLSKFIAVITCQDMFPASHISYRPFTKMHAFPYFHVHIKELIKYKQSLYSLKPTMTAFPYRASSPPPPTHPPFSKSHQPSVTQPASHVKKETDRQPIQDDRCAPGDRSLF